MAKPLTDPERLDWLRLIRSENVGPITFFQLLRRFGSAAAALDALPALAQRGGRSAGVATPSRADAERELAAVAAAGARLVGCGEPEYPAGLAAIADPPPLISVRGNPALAMEPTRVVAIVGARNASGVGTQFARTLAADLGARGLVVASGLARGVDAAAHTGALATGTIAAMAGGIDVPYPPENAKLYESIVAQGFVLSEQPPGTEPQARHFPRRNRLISGMAIGVVVVEAALRSGSLITARMALEQGREVFAVPGSPLDPRCRGTNDLIRQGATLTEGADDVVQALAGVRTLSLGEPESPSFSDAPEGAELGRGRAKVVELLSPTPLGVDELIRQSELTPAVVLTILLELEIAGRVQRHPGNQVSLK